MNTVTLDNATYNEMYAYARLNNVSITDLLKTSWKGFMEYVKSKNRVQAAKLADQDFLDCFSGDWENEKSTAEIVDDYRRSSFSDPEKNIAW